MSESMNHHEIAILGGTFDPVHNGHLAIAEYVINQLHFSHVIFVPNKIPPHRDLPIANEKHRLSMLQRSLGSFENFSINTNELERNGPSYMIDTVKNLRSEYKIDKQKKIWLILGQDAFNKLPTWHRYDELIAECGFIVLNRSGHNNTNMANQVSSNNHLEVQYINTPPIDISATEIRNILKSDLTKQLKREKLEKLLPIQVLNYIQDNNLYS